MSNLQVPDPGLLWKLETFVLENLENHFLDVRIVCGDGDFLWSSILLSSLSPLMKSLLLDQSTDEAPRLVLLPDVNKEDLQYLLHSVISTRSLETRMSKNTVKLLLLLGIEQKFLRLNESSNVKIVSSSSSSPKLEKMSFHEDFDTEFGGSDGIDILFKSEADPLQTDLKTKTKSSRKMYCKLCSLSFESKSYSEYQDHINSHKNSSGLFVCNYQNCSKTFKAWCHLTDHFYCHGSNPKPHLCSYCSYTSITRANVRKHEIAVHEDPDRRDFVCSTCQKRFKTSSNLMEHAKIHLDSKHRCEFCKKEFKSQVGYNQHLRVHSGALIGCEICGEKFQSRHSVNRHQKDIHGMFSNSDGKKVFRCQKKECSAEFSQEEEFRLHVKTAHQEKASVFICHLCRKFCTSTIALKQHFKKMHPIETETKSAGKPVKNNKKKSLLKLAQEEEVATPVTSGNSQLCECCNKVFRQKFQLLSHQIVQQSRRLCCAVAGCSLTDQEFSSVKMLELHLQQHTGELGHYCSICDRTFSTELARDKHEATHEEGDFTCSYCQSAQPSRLVLNMHQRYCTSREQREDILLYVEDQNSYNIDQTETVIMM